MAAAICVIGDWCDGEAKPGPIAITRAGVMERFFFSLSELFIDKRDGVAVWLLLSPVIDKRGAVKRGAPVVLWRL